MSDPTDRPDLREGIPAGDLGEGVVLAGRFGDEPVLLVRQEGKVCALAATCTHLQAPLASGRLADGQLTCPWHHARFSIATGEAVAAPAFDPLALYDVEEAEGRLRVTGRRETSPPHGGPAKDPGRVVIVGGGAAGHACAELLARAGHGHRVTLVSDDLDRPYDRTFASKQYLVGGQVSRDDCLLGTGDLWDGVDNVVLRQPRRVIAIDPAGRTVGLDDGETLFFDHLVLATGAEPIRPDAPGLDHPDVHVLRTLRDADRICAGAGNARHAAVIGASFVALEAAASLRQRGLDVDVVAPDAVPLAKVVGEAVGGMIRGVHEGKGVRFNLGRTVAGYHQSLLSMDDGSTLFADLVVVGAGVTPRTDLAEAAGLALASDDEGGGVRVDERLRTSDSRIFAVGDIASYPEARLGRRLRIEHWVHAQRQGQHVARTLMGDDAPFTDTPFFWSAHFDTGLRYVGHAPQGTEPEIDGSVEQRDLTARYRDAAVVTCNRDGDALDAEAAFDAAIRPA